MNVQKWLTEEEYALYRRAGAFLPGNSSMRGIIKALESLAACRAILKDARDYIEDDGSGMPLDATGNGIVTAIATALKGLPRKEKNDERNV